MSRHQRSGGGRLLLWAFLLGLLVAALLYLRCGDGLGFGPGGEEGEDSETEATREPDVRPAVGETTQRCQLRLDAQGITVDGKPATIDKAVEICKKAGGGELVTTGDAVYGTQEDLKMAFDVAGVPLLVRDPATAPSPSPQ